MSTSAAPRPASPLGRELARLRRTRGMSQLRLAAAAETSPRHVSFVETGRSRPGRAFLLRLADALELPLRERNRLLVAAGFAPAYAERPLDDAALAPQRTIIAQLLAQQEPYPAFVFDRALRLRDANRAAQRLLPAREGDGIELFFAPTSPLRAVTENFAEVAYAALAMLRRDDDGSPAHADAVARLAAIVREIPAPAPSATRDDEAPSGALTARFRLGSMALRTVTTLVRFSAARDVTVDGLHVELVFPADEETARNFATLAALAEGPAPGFSAR